MIAQLLLVIFLLSIDTYINAIENPGIEGFLLARCLTGLGPNGTGDGANGALGGWYLNDTMIPNSGETVECTSPSVGVIQTRPGGRTAGVINIRQCGAFSTTKEGIYTCTMMNSSMMDQSVRLGVYFNGRS